MTEKGWYEITALEPLSMNYMDTLKIPTKIVENNNAFSTEVSQEVVDNRVTTEFVDQNLVNGELNL
jgi:hypothetical protein